MDCVLPEADLKIGENLSARLQFFGDEAAKKYSVYIADIPQKLDQGGLYNLLLACAGKPNSLRMVNANGKRIAFADFSSMRAATTVIQDLNNKPPLFLKVATSKQKSNDGGLRGIEDTVPKFASPWGTKPDPSMPPSSYQPPATRSVGRGGATRRATAVHRAYRTHLLSRTVQNSEMWSPGPADVYDAAKFMCMSQSTHEDVNLKLLSSLEKAVRHDNRRISMGRGYYVYPKRCPAKSNSAPGPSRMKQSFQRESNGVYSFGDDPQAPAVPCASCNTPCVKKCYVCGTPYCSEECRGRDREKHNTQCKPRVCIDITVDAKNGDKRSISLKPLCDPIQTEALHTEAPASLHSRASVIEAMRQSIDTEGFLEVSKCSPDSKAVYGTLCCSAGRDAMCSLVVGIPDDAEKTPFNANFSPEKGSLVAVSHQDGWWRGVVVAAPSQNFDEYRISLMDTAKVVTVQKWDLRPLPAKYADIPEFGVKGTVLFSHVQEEDLWSTYFQVRKDLQVFLESAQGSIINCNVKSEEGVNVCRMQFQRWNPEAHLRENQVVPLTSGCRVVLTSYHNQHALYVRPTGKQHVELRNTVLQQVAAAHAIGLPLRKPPRRDEMVACKFLQDGNYYRAVVHEASIDSPGKYKVWFVDFGNHAEVGMDQMKPLPADLKNYQFLAVKVSLKDVSSDKLTIKAAEYLNDLLDKEEVLRIEYSKSIEYGVRFISRDGTDVNKKLNVLLQPSWKIALRDRTKIYEEKVHMLEDLRPLPLIEDKEAVETPVIILHVKTDGEFSVLCCPANSPFVPEVLTSLNAQINEFCDSAASDGSYNPRKHEICLARHPDGSWQRALSVESITGGSRVIFLDFGGTSDVIFRDMRRILPDFLEMPTLVSSCQIKGLPAKMNNTLKEKIKELLKPNTVVKVQNVKAVELGINEFVIELPQVLSALRAQELLPL